MIHGLHDSPKAMTNLAEVVANHSVNTLVSRMRGGIVKLSERWAEEGDFMRDELGRSARLGDLAPSRKGSLARSAAEVSRDGVRIRDVEEVGDLIVNRQKPLGLPR